MSSPHWFMWRVVSCQNFTCLVGVKSKAFYKMKSMFTFIRLGKLTSFEMIYAWHYIFLESYCIGIWLDGIHVLLKHRANTLPYMTTDKHFQEQAWINSINVRQVCLPWSGNFPMIYVYRKRLVYSKCSGLRYIILISFISYFSVLCHSIIIVYDYLLHRWYTKGQKRKLHVETRRMAKAKCRQLMNIRLQCIP